MRNITNADLLKSLKRLSGIMLTGLQRIDARLAAIDSRLEALDVRFALLDDQMRRVAGE